MQREPVFPLDHREQLDLLISRGMSVREPEEALRRLKQVNYARLKGYLLPFRQRSGRYLPGTSFERVYQLYVFDARLRGLLFPVLSEVELTLRSNLSYFFSRRYGAFGYLEKNNFERSGECARFQRTVQIAIRDEDNASFLSGHRKQDGHYPVGVVLELLSMGGLAHFLANLHSVERETFAWEYYGMHERTLCDWTTCFTLLRNAVAHYCRLYFAPFAVAPCTPSNCPFILDRNLFDYLYVARGLYPHERRWNESFLTPLQQLLDEYGSVVERKHIGFPPNWYELLAK